MEVLLWCLILRYLWKTNRAHFKTWAWVIIIHYHSLRGSQYECMRTPVFTSGSSALSSFRYPILWSIDLTVSICHIQYTFLSLCQFFHEKTDKTKNTWSTIFVWYENGRQRSLGVQSINTESLLSMKEFLTLSLMPESAPLSNNFVTISTWPRLAATWSDVPPSCPAIITELSHLTNTCICTNCTYRLFAIATHIYWKITGVI